MTSSVRKSDDLALAVHPLDIERITGGERHFVRKRILLRSMAVPTVTVNWPLQAAQ